MKYIPKLNKTTLTLELCIQRLKVLTVRTRVKFDYSVSVSNVLHKFQRKHVYTRKDAFFIPSQYTIGSIAFYDIKQKNGSTHIGREL